MYGCSVLFSKTVLPASCHRKIVSAMTPNDDHAGSVRCFGRLASMEGLSVTLRGMELAP